MDLVLTVEPIPEKNWGKNLAQTLPKEEWDPLRRLTYARYNWTCQTCDAYGVEVHCHEVWAYEDKRKTQKLVGLICLCRDCHNIKHWGRTIVVMLAGGYTRDYINLLTAHFCKVNKCTEHDFVMHLVEVGDQNIERNRHQYRIDLSLLPKIIKEYRVWVRRQKKLRLL